MVSPHWWVTWNPRPFDLAYPQGSGFEGQVLCHTSTTFGIFSVASCWKSSDQTGRKTTSDLSLNTLAIHLHICKLAVDGRNIYTTTDSRYTIKNLAECYVSFDCQQRIVFKGLQHMLWTLEHFTLKNLNQMS